MHQILQGEDPRDDATMGVPPDDVLRNLKAGAKGLRIGIPQHAYFDEVDAEVDKAVRAAAEVFRDLGATVENVAYPEAAEVSAMAIVINGVEAAVIHEDRLENQVSEMDPVVGLM